MDRYFEKYVELTQAENPVTWPDLLHRHEHAHKSPGMIVCFRVAPNSSPSPKSLPAPKKKTRPWPDYSQWTEVKMRGAAGRLQIIWWNC